jgi:putative oxidoreductase
VFDHIGVFHLVIVIALTFALHQARRLRTGQQSGVSEGRPQRTSGTTARTGLILVELIELTLAAVFFLVGGAKLIGRPDMVRLFHDIGIGQWFRYVTGTIEVTGALLLIIPFLSGAAAIGLGAVMIVASLVELLVLHRPPLAALACLSAHTLIAWRRVGRTSAVSPRTAIERADVRSPLTRGMSARWSFPRRMRVRDSLHAA